MFKKIIFTLVIMLLVGSFAFSFDVYDSEEVRKHFIENMTDTIYEKLGFDGAKIFVASGNPNGNAMLVGFKHEEWDKWGTMTVAHYKYSEWRERWEEVDIFGIDSLIKTETVDGKEAWASELDLDEFGKPISFKSKGNNNYVAVFQAGNNRTTVHYEYFLTYDDYMMFVSRYR